MEPNKKDKIREYNRKYYLENKERIYSKEKIRNSNFPRDYTPYKKKKKAKDFKEGEFVQTFT